MNRLLFINTEFSGGGAANIANMIFNEVCKYTNITVNYICRNKRSSNSEVVDDFNIKMMEVYFNGFITKFLGKDSIYYYSWKKNFNKNYLKNYDIIHLHNIHGYFFDIRTMKLLSDKKVIWTFHDMWPITGHCSHSLNCNKWEDECFKCPNKNMYPSILLDTSKKMYKIKKEMISYIKDLSIVVSSEWLYKKVSKSFLKSKKLSLIRNGVDKSIFYPRKINNLRNKYDIKDNKKIILFVAEDINNKWKGVNYLINAINNLKEYKNLLLVIIGKKMELKKVISKKVQYMQLGYINDRNTLAQIYSDSDIFITTSIAENYPCTIQESLSCGTPCIGYKIGGIPELIINNKTGFVIENVDTDELRKKIEEILQNNSIIKNLKKYILNNLNVNSKEKMVEEYLGLYNK